MIGIYIGKTIMVSFGSTFLYTYYGGLLPAEDVMHTLRIEEVIRTIRNCRYKSARNEPFCGLDVQNRIVDSSAIAAARDGNLYPADEFAMVYLVPTHHNQTLLQVFNVPIPETWANSCTQTCDTWRLVYEEVIPESLSPHQVPSVPVAPSYLKLTGAEL